MLNQNMFSPPPETTFIRSTDLPMPSHTLSPTVNKFGTSPTKVTVEISRFRVYRICQFRSICLEFTCAYLILLTAIIWSCVSNMNHTWISGSNLWGRWSVPGLQCWKVAPSTLTDSWGGNIHYFVDASLIQQLFYQSSLLRQNANCK